MNSKEFLECLLKSLTKLSWNRISFNLIEKNIKNELILELKITELYKDDYIPLRKSFDKTYEFFNLEDCYLSFKTDLLQIIIFMEDSEIDSIKCLSFKTIFKKGI